MIQNLDIDQFLENYWQKKPLLIRSAFPHYSSPISSEELAGLACEDFVESRIITEQSQSPKWTLENGPFDESKFSTLPKSHWTLLIQGLNKIIPELDDLLHQFDFIPNWRIDDLMASYAAPNGSVGPHVDQYDVFLLQVTGRRKWMINEESIEEDNFESNLPLKLIKNFKTESEWILEAGDMLYLPPNVAHYGIGLEDCMTFSIGFRAPSHSELLSSFIDESISQLSDQIRYKDPKLTTSLSSGEISSSAINHIQEIFHSYINDEKAIENWFGSFITDYLNDDVELTLSEYSSTEFMQQLEERSHVRRVAAVRANYLVNENKEICLFVNGKTIPTSIEDSYLIKIFCNQNIMTYIELSPYLTNNKAKDFFCELYNSGYLEFEYE